jgi:hypothetical protein
VIGKVFGNDAKMAGEKIVRNAWLPLLCAALAVGGCNKDSGTVAPPPAATHVKPKAPAPAKAGASAAEQTAGMVQAAVIGKSQVPVELKFDVAERPKVGQPVEVNLALIAQVTASLATIQVSGAEDVSVAAGGNQYEIPSEEAGEVYRHTVSVTPKAEGVVLLNVTVLLKHDELLEQRVFSIPIIAER